MPGKRTFLFVLILFISQHLFSENLRVAVIPLDYPNNDAVGETLGSTVIDTVMLTLNNTDVYQAIAIASAEENTGFAEICRQYDCHYLVFGRLNRPESGYILSLSLFDLSQKTTTFSRSIGVATPLEIFNQTDNLIGLFLGDLEYFDLEELKGTDFYTRGKGTAEDPYLVSTASDLVNIGLAPAAHFELIDDIDLQGIDWVPIGSFSGSLNGNGHAVRHLTIFQSKYLHTGLFGVLEPSATVRNIILEDVQIEGFARTGSLCAMNKGTIEGCEILGGFVSGEWDVGGLSGYNEGTVEGSYTELSVTASLINGGGLIGYNGGLIRYSGSRCIVHVAGEQNYNNRDYPFPDLLRFAGKSAGGLVGASKGDDHPEIIECYSYSQVSSASGSGGVLVGYANGLLENCYAVGSVTISGDSAGGLLGSASDNCIIRNCFSYTNNFGSGIQQGSFIGYLLNSTVSLSAAAIPPVQGRNVSSVGQQYSSSINIRLLNNTEKLLDASRNPFKKWDFETVWEMTARGPILRNAPYPEQQDPIGYWEQD